MDAAKSECVAERILRISRVVSDLKRAALFYEDCLGFQRIGLERTDPETLGAFGLPDAGAEQIVLRLGSEEVALVRFTVPGEPYPPDSRADDLWFQHLAIVVEDMDVAYASLSVCNDWRPISIGGPQTLPAANGGVRAFKFRDPDGHPLELIWFPPRQGRPVWHESAPDRLFLGIDHSALSVSSQPLSLSFYAGMGFNAESHSLNQGPAQDRLDGLAKTRLHVTGLHSASPDGPGLELLAYEPPGRSAAAASPSDVLTDWVTLAVSPPPAAPRAIRDPDGHRLLLVAQSAG